MRWATRWLCCWIFKCKSLFFHSWVLSIFVPLKSRQWCRLDYIKYHTWLQQKGIDWQHALSRSILQPLPKKLILDACLYLTVFSRRVIIGDSSGMDNLNHHNYGLQYKISCCMWEHIYVCRVDVHHHKICWVWSKLYRYQWLQLVYFVFVLRSEEHTSELQSHVRISYAVFCLKKKKKKKTSHKV